MDADGDDNIATLSQTIELVQLTAIPSELNITLNNFKLNTNKSYEMIVHHPSKKLTSVPHDYDYRTWPSWTQTKTLKHADTDFHKNLLWCELCMISYNVL